MKNLIRHLLRNNLEEILSKSLLDCHCKGLHSIMLLESPGKTIRLYIAEPGNELYKNSPATIHKYPMSLGFHAHHCNLSLSVVKGTLVNWVVKPVKSVSDLQDYVTAHLFEYKSAIKTGSMDINLDKVNQLLLTEAVQILNPGDMVMMEASAIHTVSCNTDEVTAWLVFEGKEDSFYQPKLWSNWDITEQDYSKMYRKIELMKLIQLLQSADLMVEV